MTFQAVLFDMDGVVIDTEKAVSEFWQTLADRHGVTLTGEIFDRHILGSPSTHTLDMVFPHLTAEQRKAVHDDLEFAETHQTYVAVSGVVALLQALCKNGVPTALVTSGLRFKVDAVLDQLALRELFTVQVTADNITRGKPDPECYRLAAQYLGIKPERCIVFEDAVNGVKAAVSAGMYCVGVRPARSAPILIETGAQAVIPDFSLAGVDDNGDSLTLRLSPDYRLQIARH